MKINELDRDVANLLFLAFLAKGLVLCSPSSSKLPSTSQTEERLECLLEAARMPIAKKRVNILGGTKVDLLFSSLFALASLAVGGRIS
jgi:hypothetical protein